MNRLEEEYKNRFTGQQSKQGIDAEDLWEGIAEGLGHTAPVPLHPKTYIMNILIVMTILILLLWGFCSKYTTNKENIAGTQNELLPSGSLERNPDFTPNLYQEDGKDQSDKENSVNKTTKKPSPAIASTKVSKTNAKHTDKQKNKLIKGDAAMANPLAEFNYQSDSNPKLPQDPLSLKPSDPVSGNFGDAFTKKQHYQNPIIDPLDLLPFSSILSLALQTDQSDFTEVRHPSQKKSINLNQFQIALYTGINTMFTQYKDKNTNPALWEELTAANSPELGRSASIRLSWLRNSKYSLSTGIDFDQIRVKFQSVKESETTLLQDGYLTGFDLDSQTGDTINQVYETVSLRAIAKRSVIHHNHFNLVSIPLEVGIQQQKGKFGFGVNLGVGLNFFIAQNGKTLNSDREIQSIDDTLTDDLPFRKFSFSYHLNPFVAYKLSDRIKLRLNPTVRYQSLGLSRLYGLKQTAVFTSVNLGLVFKI